MMLDGSSEPFSKTVSTGGAPMLQLELGDDHDDGQVRSLHVEDLG